MASGGKPIKTRAGLQPSNENELPYSVSTSDVQKYLQEKFDVVMTGLGEDTVQIRVYTTEAGREFFPFVIVMPMEVCAKKSKSDERFTGVFDNLEDSGTTKLLQPVYNLVKSLGYTKDDAAAFFSDDWRRKGGVSRQTSAVLKSLRTPKATNLGGNRVKVIPVLLDPIKVFYDMLKSEDDKRDYHIDINKCIKVRDGEYVYKITRVLNGKGRKGKNRDDVIVELNRYLRGN